MGFFQQQDQVLIWQDNQNKLWIQPWGKNGIRVQANLAGKPLDLPQALLEPAPEAPRWQVAVQIIGNRASVRNGKILAEVASNGRLRFFNAAGKVLIEEPAGPYFAPPNRHFIYKEGRLNQIEAWFASQEGERFYGLGQHQHGRLDNKGCVIDAPAAQYRSFDSLYALEPRLRLPVEQPGHRTGGTGHECHALGGERLAAAGLLWSSAASTPAGILESYADCHRPTPRSCPRWASGFWQCKLRYETQERAAESRARI